MIGLSNGRRAGLARQSVEWWTSPTDRRVCVRGLWKMTRLWKSANNADSHKPLGFAVFSTGPTAGTHHHQPVFRKQRSTLKSGISCLKNGDTLKGCACTALLQQLK